MVGAQDCLTPHPVLFFFLVDLCGVFKQDKLSVAFD